MSRKATNDEYPQVRSWTNNAPPPAMRRRENMIEQPTFEEELRSLINRRSRENKSDTPDYILAEFMHACLNAFEVGVAVRDKWYGFKPWTDLHTGEVQVSRP